MWLNDTSYSKMCPKKRIGSCVLGIRWERLILYTDSEGHNAQHYRRIDGRTDDIMMPVVDNTV